MSNGIASREARPNIDMARQSKIAGIEHFIGAGILQHCFGVYTRSMCKCARRGYRRIKRNSEIQALRYVLIECGQLREVIRRQ